MPTPLPHARRRRHDRKPPARTLAALVAISAILTPATAAHARAPEPLDPVPSPVAEPAPPVEDQAPPAEQPREPTDPTPAEADSAPAEEDTEPPMVARTSQPAAPNAAGWFLRVPTLTLTASDGGTGLPSDGLRYRVDGGAWVEQASLARIDMAPFGDGVHEIEYVATDRGGNSTGSRIWTVRIDTAKPVVAVNAPVGGSRYDVGEAVTADYGCSDPSPGSGLASCDGTVAAGEPIDTSAAGEFSFEVLATDRAGNFIRERVSYTVGDDTEAPRIAFDRPALPASGWYRGTRIPVGVSATDDVGIEEFRVRIDGEEQQLGGPSFDGELTTEGRHTVEAWARDLAGNETGWQQIEMPIDFTAPSIAVTSPARYDGGASLVAPGTARAEATVSLKPGQYVQGSRVPAEYSCDDALSGMGDCRGDIASGDALPTDTLGIHTFHVEALDVAGNRGLQRVTYEVVAAPDPGTPSPGPEQPTPAAPGAGGPHRPALAATGGADPALHAAAAVTATALGGLIALASFRGRRIGRSTTH